MDSVIDELNNYVDCCATCDIFLCNACGFINKSLSHKIVGEEAYSMMDEEELKSYQTQVSHYHCEAQISKPALMKELKELVEKAEMTLCSDWLLKMLSKLYEIKAKVDNSDPLFKNCFKDTVNEAIQLVIARVDLIFLQNQISILNFLEMSEIEYDRDSCLSKLCPKKVIQYYEMNAKPLDGFVTRWDAGTYGADSQHVGENESGHLVPMEPEPTPKERKISAAKEMRNFLSDDTFVKLIESFLAKMGYKDVAGIDTDESGIEDLWKDLSLKYWFPFDGVYLSWENLQKELCDGVKRNVDDIIQMKRFLFSIIKSASGLSHYFFPDSTASIRAKEAAALLKLTSSGLSLEIDTYQELWPRAIAIARERKAAEKLDDKAYMDALYRAAYEEAVDYGSETEDSPITTIGNVRKELHHLALIILEALMLNHVDIDYAKLQEECGVTLSLDVKETDVFDELDWGPLDIEFYTNWKQSLLPHMEQVEMPDDDLPFIDNDLCQECSEESTEEHLVPTPTEPELTIPQGVEPYLESLSKGGYIDTDNRWIKAGHTNYHAGWAAKIIIKNVPGITYAMLSSLFNINNLAGYASKVNAEKKQGIKRTIEILFNRDNLSTTV
jgi:hypothetical protein